MLEKEGFHFFFHIPYTKEMENNITSTSVELYFEIWSGIKAFLNLYLLPTDWALFPHGI